MKHECYYHVGNWEFPTHTFNSPPHPTSPSLWCFFLINSKQIIKINFDLVFNNQTAEEGGEFRLTQPIREKGDGENFSSSISNFKKKKKKMDNGESFFPQKSKKKKKKMDNDEKDFQ